MKLILIGLLVRLLVVLVVQGSEADVTNNIFKRTVQFNPTTTNRFPHYHQNFIDILYSLMQNSIALSIQEVQLMQAKIEEIFNQVYDQILEAQQNVNDILDQILKDYESLFVNDNIHMHPCVQRNMEAMKNITANGQNVALNCIETSIGEVDNIRESVTPYIESINSSMKIIFKVTEQCSRSSNQIAKGICVVQNVEVVANSVTAINDDINEAVRLASLQIYVVGENAQGCIQSSFISTTKEANDIVAVVNGCATEN